MQSYKFMKQRSYDHLSNEKDNLEKNCAKLMRQNRQTSTILISVNVLLFDRLIAVNKTNISRPDIRPINGCIPILL